MGSLKCSVLRYKTIIRNILTKKRNRSPDALWVFSSPLSPPSGERQSLQPRRTSAPPVNEEVERMDASRPCSLSSVSPPWTGHISGRSPSPSPSWRYQRSRSWRWRRASCCASRCCFPKCSCPGGGRMLPSGRRVRHRYPLVSVRMSPAWYTETLLCWVCCWLAIKVEE